MKCHTKTITLGTLLTTFLIITLLWLIQFWWNFQVLFITREHMFSGILIDADINTIQLRSENKKVLFFFENHPIQSSSNLQETRTGIKSWMSSNFGHIWPVILELHALEWWKRWCLQLFSVTFDWIFVKLAVNEDRHKSSNKFEFGPDWIIHFEVIRPWARIFFP